MIIVMSDKAGSLVDQQEENKLISGYSSRSHNENTSWNEALLVEPLPTTCFLTLFPSWKSVKTPSCPDRIKYTDLSCHFGWEKVALKNVPSVLFEQ